MKTLFLFLIITSGLQAQVMWQVKTNESKKWYYQDGDEFNDFSVNQDKWKLGMPWGNAVLTQDLYFSEDNVSLVDGKLVITTKKEKRKIALTEWEIDKKFFEKSIKKMDGNQYEFDYTSGMVSSKKQFKYGYFETRFKSNAETGMWPAFWLYGGNPNEEIDFFELKGEKDNQIHVDVHCPNGCDNFKGGFLNLKKNWGGWIKTNQSLANDWNIISGEWQPGYVKFYLNGQPIAYFEGNFKTFQNVFLNGSVAKTGGPFSPGPDNTTKWPNEFIVDYVRIWSKEDTVQGYRDNFKVYEHTPITIKDENLYETDLKKKVNFVYDKVLNEDLGTITLLPILYNKYSLSVCGKKFGKIQVDVIDRNNKKVAGFGLENKEYYILDLSALETGPYNVVIKVLNQELIHNIPVLNPANPGIQKQK